MNLLHRIERHLKRTGGSASALGRRALNDPAFVRHLRNGRQPRPETVAKLVAAMEAEECARKERPCAR